MKKSKILIKIAIIILLVYNSIELVLLKDGEKNEKDFSYDCCIFHDGRF